MDELKQRFDLAHMRKSSAIFDRAKLEWVCGMHLRKSPDDEFVRQAFQYIHKHALLPPAAIEKDPDWFRRAVLLFKDNIHNFAALKDRLAVFEEPLTIQDKDAIQSEEMGKLFDSAAETLEQLPGSNTDFWQEWTAELKKKTKLKGKDLFVPLRAALSGRKEGPELRRLVELLGRKRSLERLRQARKTIPQ